MSYNLGRAIGQIILQYNGRGADDAQAGMRRTHGALGAVGTAGIAAGAAIAAGLGLAVKSAADFEKSLSGIKAVSGATTEQMEAVRAKALQLGKDTKFSAGEAALAIEELAKAGLTLPDIMNGAADATVALAAAGEIELPEAATIASNAMNAFGLAAKEMPKVADAIAGAANASAIDVSQFGLALQQVGAVAHLTGLSFEDTAIAIAQLGNAGIKGSDAGTSLKTMFQNLIPVTDKQIKLSKQMGLITKDGSNAFFDQTGKVKSLAGIQQVLQDATKGMTKEQKLANLSLLFGSDSIRAVAVLAEGGAAGYDKMAAAMGKVGAADVAKTRMDNFAGSIELLKGSLETLGITIGTIFLPYLRKIADGATALANSFLSLPDHVQKIIGIVIAAAGALLLIGGVILKLIPIVLLLGKIFIGALTFITGPVGLALVAIALLAVGIFLLYKRSEAFRDIVQAAWTRIKEVIAAAIVAIMPHLEKIKKMFMEGLKNAMEAGRKAFEDINTAIQKNRPELERLGAALLVAGKIIGGIVVVSILVMLAVLAQVGNVVAIVIKVIAFLIVGFINLIGIAIRVRDAIVGFVTGIIDGFQSAKSSAESGSNSIIAFFQMIWNAITGFVSGVVSTLQQWGANVLNAILAPFRAVAAALAPLFAAMLGLIRAVWALIFAIVRFAMSAVKAFILTVLNGIRAFWSAVWNGIVAVITAIWARIGGTVMAGVNRVRGVVTSVFSAVRSFVVSIWNAIAGFVSSAISRIIAFVGRVAAVAGVVRSAFLGAYNAAASAIGSLISLAGGIAGRVLSAVGNLGSILYNAGKSIIQGLINGVTSMITSLTSKLSFITKLIPKSKGPRAVDIKLLADSGEYIMTGLINALQGKVPDLVDTLKGITSVIPTTVVASAVAPASTRPVTSAPAAAATTSRGGDSFNLTAITDADPREIMQEFAWASRSRMMGVVPG